MVKQMNINPSCKWSPSQWYNSKTYQVSYKRNYKAASSSICSMLGEFTQDAQPKYDKRFSVVRDPYSRAVSIYNEMFRMGKEPGHFTGWLNSLFKKGFTDKHQFPQWFWLNELDLQLFDMEEMENVKAFIGSVEETPCLNKSSLKVELTATDKTLIQKIYGLDFTLYQSVIKT